MEVSRQSNTKPLSHFKWVTAGAATLFLAYFAFDAFSRRQIVRATLYGVGAIFPGWIYFRMMKGADRQAATSATDPLKANLSSNVHPAAPPATSPQAPVKPSSEGPHQPLASNGPSSSSASHPDPDSDLVIVSSQTTLPSSSYPASPSQPKKENLDYWLYLRKIDRETERSLSPNCKKFREKVEELIDQKVHLQNTGEEGDGFLHAIAHLVMIYYPRPSKWERQYPEMTSKDTMSPKVKFSFHVLYHLRDEVKDEIVGFFNRDTKYLSGERSGFLYGAHQPTFSYSDDEIIEVIALPGHARPDGKRPLFQSGQRGCCGATGAMIASDLLGRECEVIKGLNLDRSDRIERDLESFGVVPIRSEVSSLEELRQKLEEHRCSAQVSVDSCGGHVIVVDSVQEDRVEIRDPYHGWAVALTVDAFMRSWRAPGYRGPSVIHQAKLRTS